MKKTIPFLILIAICAACEIKPSLIKTWKITKIDLAESDTVSDKLYQDAYLSFYNDGGVSYYQEIGNENDRHALYRTGQWKEYGSGINITLERMDFNNKLNIRELATDWLALEFIEGSAMETQLKCQATSHYKTSSKDLLDPVNNTWRIKPKQKETRDEIEARVTNHVQYLIDYFAMVDEKEQGYFETTHLQTPLRFYSNGLSLPVDFKTSNAWISCFYDEADAETGGKMLTLSMQSMEEFPATEKSYSKRYHNALVIMKEYLEK